MINHNKNLDWHSYEEVQLSVLLTSKSYRKFNGMNIKK